MSGMLPKPPACRGVLLSMAESRAAAATRARDIVLRFGVAYWVLLILPFPLNGIPYLAAEASIG